MINKSFQQNGLLLFASIYIWCSGKVKLVNSINSLDYINIFNFQNLISQQFPACSQLPIVVSFVNSFFHSFLSKLIHAFIYSWNNQLINYTHSEGLRQSQIKPKFNFVFPSDPFNVARLQFYTFLYLNTFSAKKEEDNNTIF